MTSGTGPFLTPLLHIKDTSSGSCGFGEEDFFMFFP